MSASTSTSVSATSSPRSLNIEDQPEYSKEVIGPDENGIKLVIEIFHNEKGQKIKRTRTIKVTRRIIRVKRSVWERRKWAKFGDCANEPPGPNPATTFQSKEDIKLDLSMGGSTVSSSGGKTQGLPGIQLERKGIRCRNCGEEGHWTSKCPKPRKQKDNSESDTASTTSKSSKYVPPHMRDGGSKFGKPEELTVRITNLPEDMTKDDLYEITDCFGRTERVHLVCDRDTGLSRGFAFVSFYSREDGQNMIDELNGYLYGSMVLSADWAKPREE